MTDKQKFLDLLKQHEVALAQYREIQQQLELSLEAITQIQIDLDKMITEFKKSGPPKSHWYYQYTGTNYDE